MVVGVLSLVGGWGIRGGGVCVDDGGKGLYAGLSAGGEFEL
jgi:hypothetical protein